jgi:5-formyltetrahydrofolate cyclo-ligase
MKINKSECREKLRQVLAKLDEPAISDKSARISNNLKNLLLLKSYFQKTIGGYYPLENEANYLLGKEFVTAFARMGDQETMTFHRAKVEELEHTKAYGRTFREPHESAELVEPDIVIVPGLGFSKDGSRIGKGKGYYDRYLEKRDIIKIGICFHEQLVDEIPTDENDQKMDFIITDQVVVEIK